MQEGYIDGGSREACLKSIGKKFLLDSINETIIVMFAALEGLLKDMIRIRLVPVKDKELPFPKYSFRYAVNCAHRIGIISNQFRDDLHIIGDIRDKYAHMESCHSDTNLGWATDTVGLTKQIKRLLNRPHIIVFLKHFSKIQKELYNKEQERKVLMIMAAMFYELNLRTIQPLKECNVEDYRVDDVNPKIT